MLLQVDQIARVFPSGNGRGDLTAIRELNFSVSDGEFLSVLGPSGCGKSTLARLIAGLDQPTSGNICFDGARITQPSRERVLTFQSYASFPWLSVERNIGFGLHRSFFGRRKNESIKSRVEELLRLVDLIDFRKAYPHELSGGMQQRLSIARSLAVQPRMMILDEPFSSVDAITRTNLQLKLREIVQTVKATTILFTHDVEEAIALSDRILVLSFRPATLRLEVQDGILSTDWKQRVRESSQFQSLRRRLLDSLQIPDAAS